MMAVYFGFSFLIFWVSFIHSCIFVNASHMFMCFISNTSSYCHIHYAHLKTGSLTQKRKHSLLQRSFLKRFIVFFLRFMHLVRWRLLYIPFIQCVCVSLCISFLCLLCYFTCFCLLCVCYCCFFSSVIIYDLQ